MPYPTKDIFLCHTSLDKNNVVRPLARKLEASGITCWLDEAEVRWGDSITAKVNEGLASSRFVIVVLSESFLDRHWPQRELNAALNEEAGTGAVRVLPLLVGNEKQQQHILKAFPLLNDKKYLVWDGTGDNVLQELRPWFGSDHITQQQPPERQEPQIPVPRVKRKATDQEKEQFIRQAFDAISDYFQKGLQEINRHYPEATGDFDQITRYKFVARVYVQGNEACRCKVWRGGLGTDGIAYSENFDTLGSDNSFNDQLVPEDTGYGLGLKMLIGDIFAADSYRDRLLNIQEAAEALWRRFIKRLEI
jgi:hypothetical protein